MTRIAYFCDAKTALLTTAHAYSQTMGVPPAPHVATPGRPDFSGKGLALFALGDGAGEIAQGAVPTTIPLVPLGDVESRDGRFFRFPMEEFEAVKARTLADYPGGMALDLRHDTESPFAESDGDFPAGGAAGWFHADTMRIEDGYVVADVEWTAPGARFVSERLFRYISPVFFADPETRVVEQIKSAALTNNPALNMPALNETQQAMSSTPDSHNTGLRAVFGLEKDASKEELFAAAVAVKSASEGIGQLEARLELAEKEAGASKELLSQANAKIAELESAEAKRDADAFAAKRDAALDAAVKSGKITPAQVEHYAALATTPEGLTSLGKILGDAPTSPLVKAAAQFNEPPKGANPKIKATRGCSDVHEFASKAGLPLGPARKIWKKERE